MYGTFALTQYINYVSGGHTCRWQVFGTTEIIKASMLLTTERSTWLVNGFNNGSRPFSRLWSEWHFHDMRFLSTNAATRGRQNLSIWVISFVCQNCWILTMVAIQSNVYYQICESVTSPKSLINSLCFKFRFIVTELGRNSAAGNNHLFAFKW